MKIQENIKSRRNVGKERLRKSLNLTLDILWGVYKSRRLLSLKQNVDVLSRSARRILLATDIKTTSMSIVGQVFCEFSRRRALVVRPRD